MLRRFPDKREAASNRLVPRCADRRLCSRIGPRRTIVRRLCPSGEEDPEVDREPRLRRSATLCPGSVCRGCERDCRHTPALDKSVDS